MSPRYSFIACVALLGTFAAPAAADVTVFETPKLGGVKVDLYGWAQPRFTWQEADDRPAVDLHPNAAFTVNRARLGTIAHLGRWGRAHFEIELAREVGQPFDAFVVLTPLRTEAATLSLQIGQFRVPFSRQNLVNSMSYQLADVAYFVRPSMIVDRDIGAMLGADLFGGRARLRVGVFNGNEPGRGQTQNLDPYFLAAARLEVSALGAPPAFEGDLRPRAEQTRPLVTVAASVMRNRLEDKHFQRKYVGADLGAWYRGASLYAELYYHVDDPITTVGPTAGTQVKQLGWNIQAGYFPPLPWVEEHLEVVARAEYIDPNIGVKTPVNDNGARDLDQSNPTWGYMGFLFGANYFLNHAHTLKAQLHYEVRNETKRCLAGQVDPSCTGYIKNNLLVAQVTAGF